MSTVFTGTIFSGLKKTLNKVIVDKTVRENLVMPRFMKEMTQNDHYEDDLQVGGPGLLTEKPEGQEMDTGTIKEGYTTRYIVRTYARKMIISQEAMEDNKYPEIIDAAKRLNRAAWKTVDIDAANVLVRGWNTAYTGGDALPLFNTSHTLPHGGTFSNTMATPVAPSRTAVITARSAVKKLPGLDSITEGYDLTKIVCPTEQWGVWEGIIYSDMSPDPGNYSEINVVKRSLNLELVTNQYWDNTTTNYCFLTDYHCPLVWRWKIKPVSSTWTENDNTVMKYGIRYRSTRGWSDPRAAYGVQA